MSNKNIFAIILAIVSSIFLYSFVLPFKAIVVDPTVEQSSKLAAAYDQATKQPSLKTLRTKKQLLVEEEVNFLFNFIPDKLHSGQFVYNLGQMANQKKLSVKSVQYSIISDTQTAEKSSEKKLLVELTLDGRYEDFESWLSAVEKSDVLVDVESFRGAKVSNNSDIITFSVKLYTYGTNIE